MSLTSEAIRGASSAPEPAPLARTFELDLAESARFLRIVSDSLSISRHYQLFCWLSGEVQQFLPHQILICAWGDFESWELSLDVISGLPGVRTAELARCNIDHVVRGAYDKWVRAGRRPLVLGIEENGDSACCHLHGAIRGMRSLLVHGVRDARGGHDSLYIALHAGSIMRGRSSERFSALVDSLVAQIDFACRRVAALPLDRVDLSGREREILDMVCNGHTNLGIAQGLAISPYTVKNHVQRIFRKIGASNRTQAAAKYNRMRRLERRLDD